ncbi:MAG: hypothetical protein IJ680_07250 [Paludibacteraceae bacterium]|nr:hypothetical protein [Paludibacteraceae bacterium]
MDFNRVTPISFGLAILLCLAMWVPDWVETDAQATYYTLSTTYQITVRILPAWLSVMTMLLVTANALLLSQLFFKADVSRTRVFLPSFVYALTFSALRPYHTEPVMQLNITLVLATTFCLNNLWQNKDGAEESFCCGLLIALGYLITPTTLYLLPLVWILIGIQQKRFSVRSMAAALIGYALVLWSPFIMWLSNAEVVMPHEQLALTLPDSFLPTDRLTGYLLGFYALVALICFIAFIRTGYSVPRARSLMVLCYIGLIPLCAIALPGNSTWLLTPIAVVVTVMAYNLMTQQNRWTTILSAVYITLLITYSLFGKYLPIDSV